MSAPDSTRKEALRSGFTVTSLEPEISAEMLEAYAAGTATPAVCEVVEAMAEVDPTLIEAVEVLREELRDAKVPVQVPYSPAKPLPRKNLWVWLSAIGGLATASLAVCSVVLISYNRLLQSNNRLLQSKFVTGSQADRTALEVAQRENSRLQSALRNSEQSQALLNNALKSSVAEADSKAEASILEPDRLLAKAIGGTLSVAPLALFSPATRGPAELQSALSPNHTLVTAPVQLRWSGPKGKEFHVEVQSGGHRAWVGNVDGRSAKIPDGVLDPGGAYSWFVAEGSLRSGWASFRLATPRQAEALKRVLASKGQGPLERGVELARLGFVQGARAEFQALAASHPALAAKLLKELNEATREK